MQEEPVISQVVVSKTIVPKVKPAPISSTQQPSALPQTTTDAPIVSATNTNKMSESAITSSQKPESNTSNEVQNLETVATMSSASNARTASNESQKPEIVAPESSTDKNQIETHDALQEPNTTENEKNEENQAIKETPCKQTPHQAELVESNPSTKDQSSPNATKDTDIEHTEPTKESPKLAPKNAEQKPPEEDTVRTLPSVNKLEPSEQASNDKNTNAKNESSPPLSQIESTAESKEITANADSQTKSLPSLKNAKAEQNNELKQLPSIGDKKKVLEAKLKGEVENTEKKRKVPPPVPKRVSTANLFQTQQIKTKQDESNPDSDVVQSDTKKLPLPTPKKISIPLNFQQNSEEDSGQKVMSPTETPKRLIIPEFLQVQPPPPPLTTHPGLAKKEEERQQELLQAEAEKLQPPKIKKGSSFFNKKGKDSNKVKATVKRTPSIKADNEIILQEVEQKIQQEKASINVNPPSRPPKKVLGVPTLASQLDISTGNGELESIFKTITKHEWHPEDDETKKEVVKSTFGEHSKLVKESSEPEKNFKPVKIEATVKTEAKPNQQKTEILKPKTCAHVKKESVGDITGVNTFYPDGFSTPPEMKETNFTFTTPISTEIYLNTDFLKESTYNSQNSPPRTPNSIMNSSSSSSIGVFDFSAQSPTALSSTPSTPKTPSTTSQNTFEKYQTTTSPKTKNAPPSPISGINEPSSNSTALSQNKSAGSLPSGFVVTSASNPFSHQTRSLVDIVPGISKNSITLPRGKSMDIVEEEGVDSSTVGKRAPLKRSSTMSGQDRQSFIVPPMSSKRTIKKKGSSIFKKK